MRPNRPALRALVAVLALSAAGTTGTGALVAASGGALPGSAAPLRAAGEHPRPIASASERTAAPVGAAPLRRLVLPTLQVVSERSISNGERRRIERMDGVQELTGFDAARVRLAGKRVTMIGVDPATFRSWTPPPTAASDGLWTRIVRGNMAVAFDVRKRLGLELGRSYAAGKGRAPVRLGAAAGLGMPAADAIVSRRVGRGLGLAPDRGMLINAPGADLDALERSVRRVLGEQVRVVRLRQAIIPTDPAGQPGPTGQPGPPREYSPPDRSGSGQPGPEARGGKPRTYKQLYVQAARRCPGLSWTVLAAIGQIESGHGRNLGPSSAGALGPMQFMPSTWRSYGIDGDGDGEADVMNPYDAVPSAARYLCANGAGYPRGGLRGAVYAYNHAWWYVREVLTLAERYAAM